MILRLLRSRKITGDVAGKHLDEISQEEGTIQGLLQTIRSQEEVTEALATQYQQAEVLLTSFQGQVQDNTPFEKKRQVVEFLVRQITIDEPIHIEYVFDKSVFSSQNDCRATTSQGKS